MDSNLAMSILFDPEGFWPQAFHADARKHIEQNGTQEQKEYLGKETIAREDKKRLASHVENNFGGKRMGALV